MAEKLDPLKLAEELEKELGPELQREMAAVMHSEAELPAEAKRSGEDAPQAGRRHLSKEELDDLWKNHNFGNQAAPDKGGSAVLAEEKEDVEEIRPQEEKLGLNDEIEQEIRGFNRSWAALWEKLDRMDMNKPEPRKIYEEAFAEIERLGVNKINEWWSWPAAERAKLLSNLKQAVFFLDDFVSNLADKEFTAEAPALVVKDAAAERIEAEKEDAALAEALAKAEREYVAAEAAKFKAEKEESKLASLRSRVKEFLVYGFSSYETDKKRVPARQEKIGGAQAEALEAKNNFFQARENLSATVKQYRDREIAKIAAQESLTDKQKQDRAKEILLTATWREAAKIEDLKAQQQIEQMGRSRRFINEKAEDFASWYKNLPAWRIKIPGTTKTVPISSQLLVSAGLFGAAVSGVALGSAAILTATFIGQVGLRSLGGAMTAAGVEGLLQKWQEKQGEKRAKRAIDLEFEGDFLNSVRFLDENFEREIFYLLKNRQKEKTKRIVMAGLVGGLIGTGVLASTVKEALGYTGGGQGARRAPGTGVDSARAAKPLSGAAAVQPAPEAGGRGGQAAGPDKLSPLPSNEGLKAPVLQPVASLEIGRRGPEGAIIDYFKGNKSIAAQYGWDGRSDLNQWAGAKAHRLWLASVEGELAKPEVAEKLKAQGFSVNAEGYAKAMHKIGRGFVKLSLDGRMSLSDDTTFLKAAAAGPELSSSQGEISSPPGATGEAALPAKDKTVPDGKTAFPAEEPAVPDKKTAAAPAGEAATPGKETAAGNLAAPPEPESGGEPKAENLPETRRQFDLTEHRGLGEKTVDLTKSALPPDRLQIIKNLVSSSASAGDLLKEIESGRISARDFGQYYAEKSGASKLSPALMDNLNKNFQALNGPEGLEKMKATRAITVLLRYLSNK